jgi:hypothetical protein
MHDSPSNKTSGGFRESYSRLSDTELLHLATQKESLRDDARQALEEEMQHRGIDGESVMKFEEQERQAIDLESKRKKIEKSEKWKKRFEILIRLVIFVLAAIIPDEIGGNIFKLPNEVILVMTRISLYFVLAAFFLSISFGGKWLTFRKSLILAGLCSIGIFLWIAFGVAGSRPH